MQLPANGAIDRILPKLKRVRALGGEKYIACCPAHQDSTPSLSLCRRWSSISQMFRQLRCESDRRIRGLSLADLFPSNGQHYRPESKAERKRRAMDGLNAWVQGRLVHVCELL